MKHKLTIDKLKEELDWLENTSWYIGNDGLPSLPLILLSLFSGIAFGIIVIILYKKFRTKYVKDKLTELEKDT